MEQEADAWRSRATRWRSREGATERGRSKKVYKKAKPAGVNTSIVRKSDWSGLPANDHRTIGEKLDLYSFQEVSPGMVYWHHNGHIIFRELFRYIREKLDEYGYERDRDSGSRQPGALARQRPHRPLQVRHVHIRVRRRGDGAEADELPVNDNGIQVKEVELQGPAGQVRGLRQALQQRDQRGAHRALPGQGDDPGRRPHLRQAGPDESRS